MNTLLPLREESLRYTSEFKKLPSFGDAMVALLESVVKEEAADLPDSFGNVKMNEQGFMVINDQKYCYNKHSLSQAIERIKPGRVSMAPYIAACPPELRFINYTYWHGQKDWTDPKTPGGRVLVRTINLDVPMVRAVVSNVYIPVDDAAVLDTVADNLGGRDVLKDATMAVYRGDKLSRYCIYWPTKKEEITAGDDIYAALKVVNSEVGASSIKVQPMAYSLSLNACYAIPRSIETVAVRHVGEASSLVNRSVNKAAEFISPFVERLAASYDDRWTTHAEITGPDVLFKAIGAAHELPDFLVEQARKEYDRVGGESRAHVAAALSRAANQADLDTADLAHDAAGKLVVSGWTYLLKYVEAET